MPKDYNELVPALKEMLDEEELASLGEDTRFIKRLRSVTAHAFVWATVLSRFAMGTPGFEAARQWFMRLTGQHIYPRPFQMRFKSAEAVGLLERTFAAAVAPWSTTRRLPRHPLAKRFADIVAWDSSLVQVADTLKTVFKGTRATAASVKVVLGISIWGMLPLVARVVAGHRHDMVLGPSPDDFRKGTLLLLDKGFVAYEHLRKLGEAGLFYLCPMRSNGGPLVVAVNAAPANARKAMKAASDGIALRKLLPHGKKIRKTWDIEVVIRARRKGSQPFRTRLVIVPGPNGEQRAYLTNLTQESPQVLRELYRLRWQIELVFKELKQDVNLTSVPTTDPNAVLVLIWASLIALAFSRTVAHWLNPLHQHCGLDAPLRLGVVTRALRAQMPLLGHLLSLPPRRARDLLEFLRNQLTLEAQQAATGRVDSLKRLKMLSNAA